MATSAATGRMTGSIDASDRRGRLAFGVETWSLSSGELEDNSLAIYAACPAVAVACDTSREV